MINRILETICAVILAITVLITFIAVIFRYVIGSALSWSFEALNTRRLRDRPS